MGVLRLEDGSGIQVPDGATPEQVEAILSERNRQMQFQRTRQAARQTYADSSTGERFLTGVARPFVETGLGVKDLAGKVGIGEGLTEEDELNLARLEEVSGGAGTAGRVAGELATFALPGGAAGKVGTKLAAAAPRMLKYAPAAADIATSAGMEALKAPTEDQSRADRAMGGAFGAAAGRTLLPLVGKAMRGVTPTPQAKEMLDAGIPLTPGMMRGGWLQGAEETLASMPIVGGKIRQRQQDALQAWNKDLLSKASPVGKVSAAGQEGMRELSEQFSKAYDDLWNRNIKFKNGLSSPGKRIEAMDDSLRTKAEAAYRRGDWEAEVRFKDWRLTLRSMLPDDVAAELQRLDRLYVDLKVLQRASSYVGAAQRGGTPTPGQLLNAAVAHRQGQAAQGRAPMQQAAQQGGQVLGNLSGKSPGVLEKTALLPIGAAASLIPMNWMAGQSQRELAELLDRTPHAKYLADALRKAKRRVEPYVRPASIGAALEE